MRTNTGNITTDATETKRIVRELHDHRLDSLKEMKRILETTNLPRLNHKKKESQQTCRPADLQPL